MRNILVENSFGVRLLIDSSALKDYLANGYKKVEKSVSIDETKDLKTRKAKA